MAISKPAGPRVPARVRAAVTVAVMALLTVLPGATTASAAATWSAATAGVFGVGDSIFMQCGDTLGAGTRSLGMVGWPGATTQDLRARLTATSPTIVWPWMTQPTHQAELDGFHEAGALVIGLGTNDVKHLTAAAFQANVEWFLQQAAGRPVLWFNIHNPDFRAQVTPFNRILASEATRRPNLRIMDWSGYTAAHPEVLAPDGVHLKSYAACRSSRFALIHAALPGVTGLVSSPDWSDPAPAPPPVPNPVTAARTAALGAATSALDCSHRYGGCVQYFTNGAIAWSPVTGVYTMSKEATATWRTFGEIGSWGYPTGTAICMLPGGGCSQQFQTGVMYWSSTFPGYEVAAPILPTYEAAGGPSGSLGYPVYGTPCALPGAGCEQEFQHGSIYWSPASGAHLTLGAIRASWLRLGGVSSVLGYPVNDISCTAGGCAQTFQSGSISWAAASGSHVVFRKPIPAHGYRVA